MKKSIIALAMGAIAMGASANDASQYTIYINPGHGGYDSNDRNVVIEPYGSGDPAGYWESKSNLIKGLALRDMLEAKGYHVVMSRVTNTTADDLGLSTIVALSNASGADLFFSIHSNATGLDARRNFPLMLFRGYDNAPVIPAAKDLCIVLNDHLLQNQVTYWTSTTPNVRGDWSFYPSWGTSGLGVLRGNNVTAMLSEGSFHDYVPEAYRLMSEDFCWLEAYHFRRTIDQVLNVPGETVGHIFGRLNDSRVPRPGDYKMFGDDLFATIQGGTVELYDQSGALVDTYTTDAVNINGVYCFKNLAPGTYTVKARSESHYESEQTVEVSADLVTYANFQLNKIRNTPPTVVSYSPVWNEGDESVLCNTPIVVQFSWDMDIEQTPAAVHIDPPVAGNVTWEDLNYRMVFTPEKAYDINTTYTVTIGTEAAHAGGVHMEQPVTFRFHTAERNFMEILGHYPKDGDAVHFHNAAIEFRFDKRPNVTPILNQISCEDSEGNLVKFNNRGITSSKNTSAYGFFRIPFQADLVPGQTYTLHVSDQVGDRDGITIQSGMDVTFTATDAGSEKADPATEEFEAPGDFTYDADGSLAVSKQTVGTEATALFGAGTKFTYTFEGDNGGEILWRRQGTDVTVTPGDIVGIHVRGDLSGNGLYLLCSAELGDKYIHVCDLDFLGWKYIEVPASELEGTDPYRLTGVKIGQLASMASASGDIALDRLSTRPGDSGIEDVEVATVTVHPNPASQYLVANAGSLIQSVELIALNGSTVARQSGNVLNVEAIAAGHYFLAVNTAAGRTIHRVVIAH